MKIICNKYILTLVIFVDSSMAAEFLPTFMYCLGSGNFDVVQTALRNLPEYVLLCQGILSSRTVVGGCSFDCASLTLLYVVDFSV